MFASLAADVCARLVGSTEGGTGSVSGGEGDGESERGEIGLSGGDERLGSACVTGLFMADGGLSNSTFFMPVALSRRGDLRGCVLDRVCGRPASTGLVANQDAAVA